MYHIFVAQWMLEFLIDKGLAMVGVHCCTHTRVVLGFFFLIVFRLGAFFESITAWRSPTGQLVYGVADLHGIMTADEVGSMRNEAQLGKIVDIFDKISQEQKQQDYLTMVEDLAGYKGHHPTALKAVREYRDCCPYFEFHASPLLDLVAKLEERQLPAINSEYRFLRVIGLKTLLSGGSVSAQVVYPSASLPVSGHEIVQEYEEASAEIDRYTDEPLHEYFQDTLKMVRATSATSLEQLGQDHGDVVQYINSRVPAEHRLFFGDSLRYFDVPLFDARVLHHIVKNPVIKKILLFCGGLHIYQIGKILERLLHYKKVAHVGVVKEYPYEKITFDPSQADTMNHMTYLYCLARLQELELIGAEEPERFSSGSFS